MKTRQLLPPAATNPWSSVNSEAHNAHVVNEIALRQERRTDARLSRHSRQRPDRDQDEGITMVACTEPSLEELLRDDTLRLMMAADGVQEGALRALLAAAKKARQGVDATPFPLATPADRQSSRSPARRLRRERAMAGADASGPDGGL
jgi:hypothetical protein